MTRSLARHIAVTILVACTVGADATLGAQQLGSSVPPVAPRRAHVTQIHGVTLHDDYFWMRQKGDSSVVRYLTAENAYTDAVMKPTTVLQQTLYDEMLKRVKQTDTSVPYRDGGYEYSVRTKEGDQYPVFVRKPVGSSTETTVFDQNAMAKGHGFYALGDFTVSNDGNLLAFSVDTTGYRQYVLEIKDLRTGAILPDRIPRTTSVVWMADNRTLLLTTEDSVTKRSDKLWRHVVGGATTLSYAEPDELFDLSAYRSRDRAMLMVLALSKTSTDVRYLPANQPTAPLRVIRPREPGHEYYADYDAGKFFIRTNAGAKNFRVVSAMLADPGHGWKEVVAHKPDVKIENTDFFHAFYILSEREHGLPYLRVVDKSTGASHRISTPDSAYLLSLGNNPEYDATAVQFVYSSLVTPVSTFSYDMRTKQRTLLKQQVVFGYDPARYESKRVWVTARDGAKVPVAMVYKKGIKLDGSAPMLLYAYGSYGFSIDPAFSTNRLSLLDRGFIYAQPAIRGGGELGEPWRDAGRMMKKMNTFNDFIDAAQYLIQNHYTSRDRLMIEGGSAGGMLMGAVANMRPDLFKAVVAQVPFVDIINTMLDASLPLTTSEYIEWGNPNEKPAFDYMMRYSPYDNVKAQAYPSMLVEVSYNDSQVPYWEGTKLVAKLRATKTDTNTLLLKPNMGAGHGGSSGRYDRYHEVAFEYAFMLSQVPSGGRVTP